MIRDSCAHVDWTHAHVFFFTFVHILFYASKLSLYCNFFNRQRFSASSSAITEGSSQQDTGNLADSMEGDEMALEEHRALIFSRPVVLEQLVTILDFDKLSFKEHTIGGLMAFQGYVSYL